MSDRKIDHVIDYINQAEYLTPVAKRVLVNRINVRPTQDEIHLAMRDLEADGDE